jgi:hypothetical protein
LLLERPHNDGIKVKFIVENNCSTIEKKQAPDPVNYNQF